MIICGIDTAKKTGIVFVNEKEELLHIEEILLEGCEEERYEQLFEELGKLFNLYQPTFIGIEELAYFRGGSTAKVLSGYLAVASLVAWKYSKCSINRLRPLYIRKIMLGEENKGKASEKKRLLNRILSARYKRKLTDNESDALAVALVLKKEVEK